MLASRITVLITLCSVTSVFAQLSPLEQKIVGTWQFTGIDATGRIVLRPDHSCATMFPIMGQWEVLAKGTWRIDGRDLVRVEKPTFGPSVPGDPPPKIERSRMRIHSVTRDEFALGDGLPMKRLK